ncbi:MAG: 3-keto-5-aminohexanoate cleavage protein [Martelella sp.]|uniref:3-keto-5-aminohexanoate cleavage protein n=1 Tax=Martelella sp. TaxID=1969699 RepID=UPI0032425F06
MIVQACINGARDSDFHPNLPLTLDAMVLDGMKCVAAGASELHVHPRDADGRESLQAVDQLVAAMRRACPGTLIGISTGDWIEGDDAATRQAIVNWQIPPDYASVNLSEADAPAIIALLGRMGVGVEAGLATVDDARRFISLPESSRVFRVLIEIDEQQQDEADRLADEIANVLEEAGIARPILLHGFDATVWHFVRRARQNRWSTRIGLEDGRLLQGGEMAEGNADLVAEAVKIFRQTER